MVAIPAACMECGAIFWAHLPISLPMSVGRVHLQSNRTNCPVPGCGGWAQIADGLFDFTREGVAILSAPQVTYEMLIALRALVRSAHQDQWPVEKLKKEAEAISPTFGGLFSPSTWSPEVKQGLILAAGAIITAYITLHQKPSAVNVPLIDPVALIDAIQGIPAQRVVEGGADGLIAKTVKPQRHLGPPQFKPTPGGAPDLKPKRNPKRKLRSKPKRWR